LLLPLLFHHEKNAYAQLYDAIDVLSKDAFRRQLFGGRPKEPVVSFDRCQFDSPTGNIHKKIK
jgi:hypothetical protein